MRNCQNAVLTTTIVALLLILVVSNSNAMRLPDPPVFNKVAHYPSVCYLPPDSGMCPSSNTEAGAADDETPPLADRLDVRYYFDITTGECFPFGVQNCGGNENRFKTITDCQDTCRMK
uniref:BPTI/Kunitz inhibitor domain-containing protein n=1 Tax=Panagrellus redivivus TaxID=6233 RepID=A0A7E4ZUI1_PANRE